MVLQISQKCQFFRFLEVIGIFLDYKFEIQNFESMLRHIRTNYKCIWRFSSVDKNVSFRLSIERNFLSFLVNERNFESDCLENEKR